MKTLFFTFFVFICLISLQAQWSTDPTVNNPICTAAGLQFNPAIATDDSGGAIITWGDARTSSYDIYAQRISSNGTVRWTSNGVAICTGTTQGDPSIISDGSGGAIIAWMDFRDSNLGLSIYAQKINAQGKVIWNKNGVKVIHTFPHEEPPVITTDDSGGVIITWDELNNQGEYDVYAQRINLNGALQWDSTGVPISTAAGRQESPAIASDDSGGAIISWMDNRNYYSDIYAQRVNSQGIVQWTKNGTPVSTGSGQADPAMISDGSGGAVITWSNSTNSDNYVIYAQKMNSNGQTLWTQPGILVSSVPQGTGQQFITSDDSGGAIIGFQSFGTNPNVIDTSIYVQRIKANGLRQWTSQGEQICSDSAAQSFPAITNDGNGGAIITWGDDRNDYGDIFAQKISSNGTLKWPLIGAEVSTASIKQEFPAIVSDGSGGAIIAWEDSRNNINNSDIYAQEINDANVLSVELPSSSAPTKFKLEQNYPNPFNPSTTIRFELPKSGKTTLRIYNILGQRVYTLADKYLKAGRYSFRINADRWSSGVYFYRIRSGNFMKVKKMILLK